MIGTILRDPLTRYTQRIAMELRVPLSPVAGVCRPGLPIYLKERGDVGYVILMPQEILSDLPVALDREDIGHVASANDEVRAHLNNRIGKQWQRDLRKSMSKRNVRDAIVRSKDFADAVIKRYQAKPVRSYNFAVDPRNELRWLRIAKYEASQNPIAFSLTSITTAADAVTAVRETLQHFKNLVEKTRVKNALYNDDGSPRGEKTVQDVFHAVATSHSLFSGLDVNPEVLTGRGTVDYKFSIGRGVKVLVEIKLARNSALVDGLTEQLPAYVESEEADYAFLLVVNNGGSGCDANLAALATEIETNGPGDDTEVVVCDGTPKATASRLRRKRASLYKRRANRVKKGRR
ncbi:MAG: hypothetical protein GIX03_10400 [Candidatus Eremiobacteraeota bacterium]|nr:hypothetical protein [Candidatus Eremiobacteraeota bacterium]MBC5804996.1 hypothetical protein [Candidatus Eremiobacteraeota bacterium]MBC5820675.1 hypothetical protein [Candidatus Eremiobacteraeota bacterium]